MPVLSKNVQQQLRNLDVKSLKLPNGKTIESELKRHAAILADCIQSRLDEVYESYEPKQYKRSYRLLNSLFIGPVQIEAKSTGVSLAVHIGFDEGAIHRGFDGQDADTALLLNDGWRTNGSFKNVPYLGYRDGTYFIEQGIADYKRKVPNPFPIMLNKHGVPEYF